MTARSAFAESARAEFHALLQQAGLVLDTGQQQSLLAYLDRLAYWNRAYNLTSLAPGRWLSEVLLDALVAMPYIDQGPILDVGSGAGLPGVPLAIAFPGLAVTCLDSNGKKTRFINQVKIELQIPNLDVVQSRIESYTAQPGYGLIVSRAYAELQQFVRSSAHLLRQGGAWLAWKGDKVDAELGRLTHAVKVLVKAEVDLPGVEASRYLIKLQKTE